MPPRLVPPLFSTLRSFTHPIPYTCKIPTPPQRAASQFRGFPGGYRRPSYNRFNGARRIADRWTTSPNFRLGVLAAGGGGLTFYIYNSETVPISGRRRFNCVPESWEINYAKGTYQEVMRAFGKKILPPNHPDSIMVNRVLRRLIPASGLGDENWEVQVIGDREQTNAFVLPGGKVFVFSGILPICKDEDGLAAVLGHEIAHNVAHHAGEKMSKYAIVIAAIWTSAFMLGLDPQYFSVLLDYMVSRPGSRAMETEADQIGLLMMARSCYDPQKAVGFWERMAKAEQFAPPQWASTHPSSENRILAIQNWIPQAQEARASSGCSGTIGGYANDFARAFQQDPSTGRAPPRRPMVAHQQQPGRRDDDDDYFF